MFKIGEFSKLARVSARMLRYYDKCGLLRPAEIDRYTGYRMYSAAQMPLLSRIVALRDMGFGIEEIDETLPNFDSPDYMCETLEQKRGQIVSAIAGEQYKLQKINAMQNEIRKGTVRMIYEVEIKELPAVKVLSLREIIPAYDAEGMLWHKMGNFVAKNGIECGTGGYSIYHDDEYKEADVDVEIATPVESAGENRDGFVYKELDAIPLAATIRFSGPYENYSATMEKLAAWAEKNGYEFAGNVRGLAIAAPHNQSDPEKYLTELQVPVIKA